MVHPATKVRGDGEDGREVEGGRGEGGRAVEGGNGERVVEVRVAEVRVGEVEDGREVEGSKYQKEVDMWNGIKHMQILIYLLQATNDCLYLHRCTRRVNCSPAGGIPLEWQTSVSQCPAITRADPPVVFFPQLMVC